VNLAFRRASIFTPLIDWNTEPMRTGAQNTRFHELIEGDINTDALSMTAKYVDAFGVDSRQRNLTVSRYGDKVQMSLYDNILTQFMKSGGKDWRPILRGLLGSNIVRKFEHLARNAFLKGPSAFHTFAGSATTIATIGSSDTFGLAIVNEWNLRLGNLGSPVVPGPVAAAKLAIIPPGVQYDLLSGIAAASGNESALWKDAHLYNDPSLILNYEVGTYKNLRFVVTPNNKYGENLGVLYNTGAISYQHGVTSRITAGDGAPDPSTTQVDGTWYVGQSASTHYVQLESFTAGDYAVNDIVSIHTARMSSAGAGANGLTTGVAFGVDPLHGQTITRRVVTVDATNNRLTFDRPVMQDYAAAFTSADGSVTTGTAGTFYAFVTKARHIGMVLVMGSRGGIMGGVAKALTLYEPKPVDDFDSVWRFSWDSWHGYNIWEPSVFEVHFCAVTLPKPGGKITP